MLDRLLLHQVSSISSVGTKLDVVRCMSVGQLCKLVVAYTG